MRIILHRQNTLAELLATPTNYGVEIDIRSSGDRLTIQHDPFVEGGDLETWLGAYRHGTLILNVKEEGLEPRLITLMKDFGIEDYFFLDQSFPFLIKYSVMSKQRSAVRVSELESIQTALNLAGKVTWAWIDYFTHFPLSHADASALRNAGLKLCLVSPELHGHNPELTIRRLVELLLVRDIRVDAVCTKRPDLWEKLTHR